MIAKDLITDAVLPLRTSDTGILALSLMDEFRVSHLPIVNDVDFLGLISDVDIYNLNNMEESIGNHTLSLSRPFVLQNQHIYEVVKLAATLRLTVIPVLDEKNHYLGVITLNDLIKQVASVTAVNDPGGIIVLEVNTRDYTLAQIAQIVESNDAKILSSYITAYDDSTKMEVTIKVNKMDLTAILQTLNRYNYIVKASYSESEYYDDLQDRFDSLMNYLNI